MRQATDLTNDLLTANARNLREANVRIRTEMERGVFDIEAVKQANADLIGTLLLELAAQAGATLVVVSHDARLTARLGRQVRLDQGRIAADGLARAA